MVKAARSSRARLSVAIIDLDDFKTINDRYGHPAGDRVLQNFAREVSRRLGPTEVFGRLGGEEFAIFFPQTGREQAADLIGSILLSANLGRTRKQDPHCTFSAGIDEFCFNDTLSELIIRADAALYCAKREGKGRVELAKSDSVTVA
ncbi:GGDEF domain-containing protein [Paraburkholderia terrae]|uniref:GGDEF domain-containing protein n=1 Tax=Paraburkholderia terrae TaxID=311230 RepID=UPI0033659D8A